MPSHSGSGGGGGYGWLPDRRIEERNKERERREREAAEYKRRHHIQSGDQRRDFRDSRDFRERDLDFARERERERERDRERDSRDSRDSKDSPPFRTRISNSPLESTSSQHSHAGSLNVGTSPSGATPSGYPESTSSLSFSNISGSGSASNTASNSTGQRPPIGPSRHSSSSISSSRRRSPSPDQSFHHMPIPPAPLKRYSVSGSGSSHPNAPRWQGNRHFSGPTDNNDDSGNSGANGSNDQRRRINDDYRRPASASQPRRGGSSSGLPSGPSYWERDRPRNWDWDNRDGWRDREGRDNRDVRDGRDNRDNHRDNRGGKWDRRPSKPYPRDDHFEDRKSSHPRDYYDRHSSDRSYGREEYFDRRMSSASRRSRELSDDKQTNSHSFRSRMSYSEVGDESNGSVNVNSPEWKKLRSTPPTIDDKKAPFSESPDSLKKEKDEIGEIDQKQNHTKSPVLIQENDGERKEHQEFTEVAAENSTEPVIPSHKTAEKEIPSISSETKETTEKNEKEKSILSQEDVKVTPVEITTKDQDGDIEMHETTSEQQNGEDVDPIISSSEVARPLESLEPSAPEPVTETAEVMDDSVVEPVSLPVTEKVRSVVEPIAEPIGEPVVELRSETQNEPEVERQVEPQSGPQTESETVQAIEQGESLADLKPQLFVEPNDAPLEAKVEPLPTADTAVRPPTEQIQPFAEQTKSADNSIAQQALQVESVTRSPQQLTMPALQIVQPVQNNTEPILNDQPEPVDILNQFAILATEKSDSMLIPIKEEKPLSTIPPEPSKSVEVELQPLVKSIDSKSKSLGAPFPLNRVEQLFYELKNIPKDILRSNLKYLELENPTRYLVDYQVFRKNDRVFNESTKDLLFKAVSEHQNQLSLDRQASKREYLELKEAWIKFCEEAEEDFRDRYEKKKVESESTNGTIVAEDTTSTTGGTSTAAVTTNNVDDRAGRRGRAVYQADSVRSEAEFLEILANLERENARDPLVRAQLTSAVVPDMIFDPIEREQFKFINSNNFIGDKSHPYKRLVTDAIDNFTPEEHESFCDAYASHPKEFGKIARMMGGKRTFGDCVLHYYQTKKKVDYKALVMSRYKRGTRKSKRKPKAIASSAVTPSGNGSRTAAASETDDAPSINSVPPVTMPVNISPTIPDSPQMIESPFEALATAAVNQAREELGDKRRQEVITEEMGEVKKRAKTTRTPRGMGKKAQQKREEAAAASAAALEERLLQQQQQELHIKSSDGQTTQLPSESESNYKISSYWSLLEIGTFERLLETFGTRWDEISKYMKNKSIVMLKNYYHKYAAERRYNEIAAKADAENANNPVQPKFEPEEILRRPRYNGQQHHHQHQHQHQNQLQAQDHTLEQSQQSAHHQHHHHQHHQHQHQHQYQYHQLAPLPGQNQSPIQQQQQPAEKQPQSQSPAQQQPQPPQQISPPPQITQISQRLSLQGPSPGFFAPRAKSTTTIIGPSGNATVSVASGSPHPPSLSSSPPTRLPQSTSPPLSQLPQRDIYIQPAPPQQQQQQPPRPVLPHISSLSGYQSYSPSHRPILNPSRTSTIASILNGETKQLSTFERGPSPQLPPLSSASSSERSWYDSRYTGSSQQVQAQGEAAAVVATNPHHQMAEAEAVAVAANRARQQTQAEVEAQSQAQARSRTHQLPKPSGPPPPTGQFSIPSTGPIVHSSSGTYVLPPLPVRSTFPPASSTYSSHLPHSQPSNYPPVQRPQLQPGRITDRPQLPHPPSTLSQQQSSTPATATATTTSTTTSTAPTTTASSVFNHNYNEQPTSRESNERGFYNRDS